MAERPEDVDGIADARPVFATRRLRYGEVQRHLGVQQRVVSYNQIARAPRRDGAGAPLPYRPERLRLRPIDVHRLLTPYLGNRFWAQACTVLPLVLYLVLFQVVILRQSVADGGILAAGIVAVLVGLMLFLEGLKLGLMPFAETIGHHLPQRSNLWVVLGIAFLLGVGVTFAEPAIGALEAVGALVVRSRAPHLSALLNEWSGWLVLTVGAGVGIAAVVGTVRFLCGWSLKPLIYVTLLPTLGLTLYAAADPAKATLLGLAWDAGAMTTGPVTVPIVLALGIGITAAAGKGVMPLSGFGIVTLASILPVLGVLVLGIAVAAEVPASEIAAASGPAAAEPGWWDRPPVAEIVSGLRAIVPLVLFLAAVLAFVGRQRLPRAQIVGYGLVLALAGMILFNLGVTYGLARLGGQSGAVIPAAFMRQDAVAGSPLFAPSVGIFVALIFAWALGFGATLAEPALSALGETVETLTSGALPKRVLVIAVSCGVGTGIALGVLKVIFDVPLHLLILPGYAAALVLTVLSSEEFVNVAWDSAGVTTGPVTVPLVLAMGLSFGSAVDVVEGFGILAMASVGPIVSVLGVGVWARVQARRARLRVVRQQAVPA